MASQTAATKSSKESSFPVSVPVRKESQGIKDRANDAVARRAYSLYLAGGSIDGQDLQHWLQAESEILTNVPEVHESSSGYTVNVPLQGFSPEQIQVSVDDKGAIIAANKTQSGARQPGSDWSSEESVFLVANWPGIVDPSTASASVKGDGLTLTVKRAESGHAAQR
jgi:HSP20 family molecular chaperone IbpA